MLPTSSRRGAGGGGAGVDRLLAASTWEDAEAAVAACWRDVEAGLTTRRTVEAAVIAGLQTAASLPAVWACHKAGLAPLDAFVQGCDPAALAAAVSEGITAPPATATALASARVLAELVAAVHAPAAGPAGPRRAAAAARVLARVRGDAPVLTAAAVAHATPRLAAGAWAAAQATAAVAAGELDAAAAVVAAAAGVMPAAAADTLLPRLMAAGAVGAAGLAAPSATLDTAARVAIDAASPSASADVLAAAAAVVVAAAPGAAAAFVVAARGVDRRTVVDASVSALAAWLVQGDVKEEEVEVDANHPDDLRFHALSTAADTASASAAVDALLTSHASLPGAATVAAVTAAWARITRGDAAQGSAQASWLNRLVAAVGDRDAARRACESRLLTSHDAASVAGAAAWAVSEGDGWAASVLARVPRRGVPPDAAVAAAVAVATAAVGLSVPIPPPATDLLLWAASGRASTRAAIDTAAAALRVVGRRSQPSQQPRSQSTSQPHALDPAAMWTLEARAAAVTGFDGSGRAPVSAAGLGADAKSILETTRQRVAVTPANAAAVARCLRPLVVEDARGGEGKAGGGAALCAMLGVPLTT